MKHVVVIGAGLGGLAAALRLAHAGFRVSVFEKNSSVGGKMGIFSEKGYRFDTGPSLLTMPFILDELFAAIGGSSAPLERVKVEPICRYVWPDGSTMEASADCERMAAALSQLNPADGAALPRFMQYGKRLYAAAVETFLFHPISSLRPREFVRYAGFLPRAMKIDAWRTYARAIEHFFCDARVRQFFLRFATYNGSSPYRTPATMAVIPYIELTFGGWYLRGGMYELARTLVREAHARDVRIVCDTAVKKILVHRGAVAGVELASGDIVEADAVVSNADAEYTEAMLLGNDRHPASCQPSLSGFVLMLGVRKRFALLGHHTILFSSNYRAEFDALVERNSMPEDPTVYICNSSASDDTQAPAGCSNLFIMVNAPPIHVGSRHDWEARMQSYRSVILNKMNSFGIGITESEIEVERSITPMDFERQFNAAHGAIYGQASNSRRKAFFRPANRSRSFAGLYYAGGSAHPGGGIPLVLLSGKHAADLIQQDFGR